MGKTRIRVVVPDAGIAFDVFEPAGTADRRAAELREETGGVAAVLAGNGGAQ